MSKKNINKKEGPKMKKYDYTGKTVFIGIDVHKRNYFVTAVVEGEMVKRDGMRARPEKLLAYIRKFFPGAVIHSAYEAGFSGFGLHRYLLENGINNIVVHAASIEVSSRDRVKTDKRDATKIAHQLSSGRLRCVHVPTTQREDYRELTRLRDKVVKERTRTANAIKAKAHYYGLIDPDDSSLVSEKWIKRLLESCSLSKNARFYLEHLAEEWLRYRDKINEINELIKSQAIEDSEIEAVYRSAPGIGPTAARLLANELGDMSQFSSERSLFSYTGLTPSEYSSGEHRRQGHISRQGKSQLRRMLVQCAWVAIRLDQNLNEIYTRISNRAGAKRAIVAIARRLVGRVKACFNKQCQYHFYSIPKKEKVAA